MINHRKFDIKGVLYQMKPRQNYHLAANNNAAILNALIKVSTQLTSKIWPTFVGQQMPFKWRFAGRLMVTLYL